MKPVPTRRVGLSLAALACALAAAAWWSTDTGNLAMSASRPVKPDSAIASGAPSALEPAGAAPLLIQPADSLSARAELAGSADTALTYTLRGRLGTSDGSQLDRPRLLLRTGFGKYRRVGLEQDLSFAIPNLAPGSFRMRCDVEGYFRLYQRIDITGDAATHWADLELVAIPRIHVRLAYPEGERPEHWVSTLRWSRPFEIVATREPPPAVLRARGDTFRGIGRRKWKGKDEGVIKLDEATDAYVSLLMHQAVLKTTFVALGQDEVTFELDEATVLAGCGSLSARFTLLDDGTPVEGRVTIRGRNQRALEDGGVLRIPALPAGRHALKLTPEVGAQWSREIEVQPGIELDLGTIEIDSAPVISGSVEGPHKDLATIELVRLDGDPSRAPWRGATSSLDRFGNTFQIKGRSPGRYLLRAKSGASRSDALVVDTRAGANRAVRLMLEPCKRVGIPGRDSWSGLRLFKVSRTDGLSYVEGTLRRDATNVQLLPGRNVIILMRRNGKPGARAVVEVGEAELDLATDVFEIVH